MAIRQKRALQWACQFLFVPPHPISQFNKILHFMSPTSYLVFNQSELYWSQRLLKSLKHSHNHFSVSSVKAGSLVRSKNAQPAGGVVCALWSDSWLLAWSNRCSQCALTVMVKVRGWSLNLLWQLVLQSFECQPACSCIRNVCWWFLYDPGEVISEKDRCKKCEGKKVIKEVKILEVHVDKGMKHGQKITFGGEADQAPGLEPGDIVLVLQEKEHEVFQWSFIKFRNLFFIYLFDWDNAH